MSAGSIDEYAGGSWRPRPGALLAERYRVEGQIGSGGMGLVLRAHDVREDRPVAIKMRDGDASEDPDLLERFEREARAVARIESDHVAHVLDTGTAPGGHPFIVFELLEGEDLSVHLERHGPLEIATALRYGRELCDALHAAHAAKIIHRDIKPANLFLAKTGRGDERTLKLLDFGLSKLTEEPLTKTSTLLGTATYMSPEHFQSAKSVDARADIWATGTVLYEMLTGRPAFEGESAPAVLSRVRAAEYDALGAVRADVPERIEAIVDRCLRVSPADRYASMRELDDELRAAAEELGAAPAGNPSAVVVLDEDANEVSRTVAMWAPAGERPPPDAPPAGGDAPQPAPEKQRLGLVIATVVLAIALAFWAVWTANQTYPAPGPPTKPASAH